MSKRIVVDTEPSLRVAFGGLMARGVAEVARGGVARITGAAPLARLWSGKLPALEQYFPTPGVSGTATLPRLPDLQVLRPAVRVDQRRLADYAHVVGLTVGGPLPVTYPHLLAFPALIGLLTRRDVHLPMLGAIHVQDHIRWTRHLQPDESLDVTVEFASVRGHRRGVLIEVSSQVQVDGDLVWQETSSYLVRGPGHQDAAKPSAPDLTRLTRVPLRIAVPGDLGRRYAAVSGDWNPIHLSSATAVPFGLRAPIAHGMWSFARTLAEIAPRLPAAGSASAWFRQAIPLGGTVALALAADRKDVAALVPTDGIGEHVIVRLAAADPANA